jgi:putative ABC transport system permease protein
MPFREAIRLAMQVIWAQKMKSTFSVIGVFIGVTFLIAVVSIIQGMNGYMTDRFASTLLGVNTFQLRRYPGIQMGDVSADTRREWRRRPRITYDDARAVTAGLSVPAITAWESTSRADIVYAGAVAKDIEIIGATEDYFRLKKWNLEQGRPFSPQEARAGMPVLVIGSELADRLFGSLDPIGREVKIRGNPYRIVGVVEPQGNLFGISLDKFAVAPALSAVKRLVNAPRVVDAVLVQAESVMRSRRGLRPAEENTFSLETSEAVLDFWSKINNVLMLALPLLVGVSVVVGGIVIMNIMLMAVAERTREIGIRKALGARRGDIMRQFLVESAALATVGAGLGIVTGLTAAGIVQATTFLPAKVAPWSIAVAVILGAGVGMTAGLYPASRAARLDPVEAMRQE